MPGSLNREPISRFRLSQVLEDARLERFRLLLGLPVIVLALFLNTFKIDDNPLLQHLLFLVDKKGDAEDYEDDLRSHGVGVDESEIVEAKSIYIKSICGRDSRYVPLVPSGRYSGWQVMADASEELKTYFREECKIELNDLALFRLMRLDEDVNVSDEAKTEIGGDLDEPTLRKLAGICRWVYGPRLSCLNHLHLKSNKPFPARMSLQSSRAAYLEKSNSYSALDQQTIMVDYWFCGPFSVASLREGRGPMPFDPLLNIAPPYTSTTASFMKSCQLHDWQVTVRSMEHVLKRSGVDAKVAVEYLTANPWQWVISGEPKENPGADFIGLLIKEVVMRAPHAKTHYGRLWRMLNRFFDEFRDQGPQRVSDEVWAVLYPHGTAIDPMILRKALPGWPLDRLYTYKPDPNFHPKRVAGEGPAEIEAMEQDENMDYE